jgi:hypothetical protein
MTYPCRYIARLDAPTVIKAWGYVEAGGLGQFDPAIYTEVEGTLPQGHTFDTEPGTAQQRLTQLGEVFKTLPLATQYAFRQTMAEVATAAQGNNLPLMAYIVAQTSVPTELEAVKQTMLTLLS